MKFVIARNEFNNLISKAVRVVAQKAAVPILSNFLIEADEDEVVITATDLTLGVRCFAKAKVLESGATTVPARRCAQLIHELTASNVEVSVNSNDMMEITADSSRFKLHGMNMSEFPSLPDLLGAMQFKIKQGVLKEMLYRTSFAVSREDNRYVLTGVLMQIANGVATFMGTDGKRLARTHMTIDLDKEFSGEYVIPFKAVDEIIKNLEDDADQDATLYLMDDKIAVESNQVTLITKLLSGEYPDVMRIIPQNSETVVSIHREELTILLKQISLFTADASHSVRFTFCDGELRLSANTKNVGEGNVSMPVNYQKEQLDIAFSPIFFLDVLRHSKHETISIGLTDAFNPGVITDVDSSNTAMSVLSPLFVLMPMRLNEE